MKKLLFGAVTLGVLVYFLSPQWLSLDKMGERRFANLEKRQNELVVGVSWPISVRRDGMVQGLKLAQDEINAQRGSNIPPIRLVIRDDKNDWNTARKIALEFANSPEMSAVIGYDEDSIGIRASSIFETSRLLHIMVNINNRAMTMHGNKYIIRTVQATDQIAKFLAVSSQLGRKPQRYAMVWEEDAYGKDIAYQYRIAQDALGSQLVYQAPYPTSHSDFRLTVNKIKESKPDIILFTGQDADTADFLHKAQLVGITTPILVASDLTKNIIDLSGTAIKRANFIGLYDVNGLTKKNRDFVAKYRSRYGQDPDTSAAQGYDALHILAEAVTLSGSENPLDLAYTIRYMPHWVGANGDYHFDGNGELLDKPLSIERYEEIKSQK